MEILRKKKESIREGTGRKRVQASEHREERAVEVEVVQGLERHLKALRAVL